MPGLFGTLDNGGPGRAAAVARDMLESLRHHAWYGAAVHVDEHAGLAWGKVSLTDRVEALRPAEAAGIFALVDGEIYDASEHRRRLEALGARFTGDEPAELLVHGLALEGEAFLARLSGYFSAVVWRPGERVLDLVSDRFGMKPLYYAVIPGGFVFGSEIKAVVTHPTVARTLSMRGVAQFFSFGHLFGDDTLFEAVRALPPASVVRFAAADGSARVTRYWRLTPQPAFGDEREALDALDASFTRAVERRTQDGRAIGLSLSGGLDARTILAAIPRNCGVKSVSLGIPGSIDHRAASEMARLAGAQHHCHYLEEDFLERFPAHLRTLVHLTDGHYLDQAITVPTLPVYRSLGIEVVLRGHAGELFHMDKAYAFSIRPSELAFESGAQLEAWLWSHLTNYMIGGVGHRAFAPHLRRDMDALARESLREALAETEPWQPVAQRMWPLFIAQRLRRETAMSMQMFGSMVDVRLPYVDNELIDAIMRVPPPLKMADRIQSFILRQRMPGLLHVLNANTGTRIGAPMWRRRAGVLRLSILAKLGVPGYQPYERLGLWLRRELQPVIRDLLLSDRALDRGIFERRAVEQVIDEHARRVRNHTYLLMAMMIFELGQREIGQA